MDFIDELNFEINNVEVDVKDCAENIKRLHIKIEGQTDKIKDSDEALKILSSVLGMTQQGIIDFIENIVSTALGYVYGDEYSFKIEYELKRNQPEIKLIPIKNDMEYDPKFSCGIGVLDVCSFSLRLAMWALSGKTTNVILIDEPFRNVHGKEENRRLGIMVKKLSKMLKLQIIIISGESVLTEYADKAFEVKLNNGFSVINGVEN